MPSNAALAVGALVAAEATGVTNLSGGGGSSGGGSSPTTVPGLSQLQGELAGLRAQMMAGGQQGQSALETAALLSQLQGQAQQIPQFLPVPGQGDGPVINLPDGGGGWTPPWDGDGGGGGGGGGGGWGGGDYDFQARGPNDPLAIIGEAGQSVGESGNAVASAVNDTVEGAGEIVGDPSAALRGESPGGITGVSYGAGQAAGAAINQLTGGPGGNTGLGPSGGGSDQMTGLDDYLGTEQGAQGAKAGTKSDPLVTGARNAGQAAAGQAGADAAETATREVEKFVGGFL